MNTENRKKYIAKTEPSYHAKAQQAIEILQEFEEGSRKTKKQSSMEQTSMLDKASHLRVRYCKQIATA